MAEQIIKGKYALDRLLGCGGMAEVFVGRTIGAAGFTRPVAIKRILSGFSNDPQFRTMFETEARLSARLAHNNVVSVLDFDEDETGRLFLVMAFVDGIDLDGLLRTGVSPLPVVLFVTSEILRGLGYAHDLPVSDDGVRGLVHRDVSPQNVLLSWDGAVLVSDFGIAKARAATNASASLFLKGKPAYMSPEQANGAALDGRSDLFGVGVMLWEMLCDERLFGRDSFEATFKSLLIDPIPSPRTRRPGLPKDVERVTMMLLEKDPGNRYRNADTAIAALAACAAYPKNGRELLSALLVERLPARARQRSPGQATKRDQAPPGVSADADGTAVAPPSLLARPVRVDPFDAAVARLARPRWGLLLALAVAIMAGLAIGVVLRFQGSSHSERATPAGSAPIAPDPSRQLSRGEHAGPATTTPHEPASATARAVPAGPTPAPSPQRTSTAPQDNRSAANMPRSSAAESVHQRERKASAGSKAGATNRGGIREVDLGESPEH